MTKPYATSIVRSDVEGVKTSGNGGKMREDNELAFVPVRVSKFLGDIERF